MEGPAVLRWCRTRPGASEEWPFGPDARVFKVGGRLFAITESSDDPSTVSLKCDPHFAEHLRSQHAAIAPGYHLNKRHWNTVRLDGTLPPGLVEELLGHSYTLVVDSLPKALREELRVAAQAERSGGGGPASPPSVSA